MGAEVLAATAVAGSLYSGAMANEQSKQIAAAEQYNAQIANQETQIAMRAKTEEFTRLKETQKMAMLKSGMGLSGSNLLVLEDTKRQLGITLDQLRYRQVINQYNADVNSQIALRNGRMALIGGITNATAIGANYAMRQDSIVQPPSGSGGGGSGGGDGKPILIDDSYMGLSGGYA